MGLFSPSTRLLLCGVCVAVAFGAARAAIPNSPIIGIVAQPMGETQQYIAASYVKFVESTGARAVALSYYASNETTKWWLDQLNGVLFPGGGADVPDVARYAVSYALEQYETSGEIFPVWGTCLGFEWLGQALGGELSDYDANNMSLPLNLTRLAASSYLLGGDAKAQMREWLATEALTMNNHNYGLDPSQFAEGQPLGRVFDVLSTSVDASGATFVSTMEAKNGVPLYGVQWHPEKNVFETGETADGYPYEAINHSPRAVAVTQAFATSLADAARRSTHTFGECADEQAALLSNCFATTALAPKYVQTYFFDKSWTGDTPGVAACASSSSSAAGEAGPPPPPPGVAIPEDAPFDPSVLGATPSETHLLVRDPAAATVSSSS